MGPREPPPAGTVPPNWNGLATRKLRSLRATFWQLQHRLSVLHFLEEDPDAPIPIFAHFDFQQDALEEQGSISDPRGAHEDRVHRHFVILDD